MNKAMMDGFLDELGQLKLAGRLSEGLIEAVIRHPLSLAAKHENVKWHYRRGEHLRHGFDRALEEGYPAGWVPLGIQPGMPLRSR